MAKRVNSFRTVRTVFAAAAEGEVLKVVREAALVVVFLKGAGDDEEAEGGSVFRLGVGEDGVAEAVFEGAEADGGVGAEVAVLVGENRRGGRRDGEGSERGESGGNKKRGGGADGEDGKRARGAVVWCAHGGNGNVGNEECGN